MAAASVKLSDPSVEVIPQVVDGDILETHKENIVPSRDGRSAVAISQLYSVPRAQRNKELAASHAHYRQLIADSQDEDLLDGDPLEPYCQYVKWIRDNYPSGSSSESGLLTILEEATRKFCEAPLYKNDRRYVHLWMEYANLVEQSERVYAFMIANDIGSGWPHPYEEFALVLERNGNRSKADGIYQLAIARRVPGTERIKSRYKEFQARCLAAPDESLDAVPPRPPSTTVPGPRTRTALGTRSVSAPVGATPARPNASNDGPRSNLGKVTVFVDTAAPSNEVRTNEWPHLDTRAESIKENVRTVKGSSAAPLPQRLATPRTPRIPIFRDESSAVTPSQTAAQTPDQALRVLRGGADLELARDPFKNYGTHFRFDFDLPTDPTRPSSTVDTVPTPVAFAPPPLANVSREVSTVARSSSTTTTGSRSSVRPVLSSSGAGSSRHSATRSSAVGPKPKPTLSAPAPGKKPEILGLAISQIWVDGEEYDRRESRARTFGLLGKKWPEPPIEEDDFSVPLKGDGDGNTKTRRKSTIKSRQSVSGLVTSSPTTNTKAALSDVFDMFNTTTRLDLDDEEAEEANYALYNGGSIGRSALKMMSPTQGVPPTPTPASTSAKSLVWTPFVDQSSSSFQHSIQRSVSTPSRLTSDATPLASRSVITSKSADTGFQVARDDAESNPQPPTRTPSAKFSVFQENGEKRLPSTAKTPLQPLALSSGAAPLSSKKPLVFIDPPSAPAVPSAEAPKPVSRVPLGAQTGPPVFIDPILQSGVLDENEEVITLHSVEPEPASSEPEPSEPVLETLAARSILSSQPTALSPSSSPVASSSKSTRFDVFDERHQPEVQDPEGEYEEEGEVEGEGEDEMEEYAPRSYERRGGVAIMTPITERTMEFGSTTRALLRDEKDDAPSPKANSSSTRILDGLDDPSVDASSRTASTSDYFDATQNTPSAQAQSGVGPATSAAPNDMDGPEPCNPFQPERIEAFISHVWKDIDSNLYRDMKKTESGHLEIFEKFAKKGSRRSRSASSTNDSSVEPMPFSLGRVDYLLLDKIGEGGFGAVFLAKDEGVAEMIAEAQANPDEEEWDIAPGYEYVAMKTVRPSMLWEFVILHLIRDALPNASECIIKPREFYHFQNESILVLDYSSQGTLLDAVNRASQIGVHSPDTSGIDELLVMFFAVELIHLVRALHGQRFIHGDLKIDNCLLRLADPSVYPLVSTYDPSGGGGWGERGVKLIDFGRAIDMALFEEGQTFVGDWATDARDCIEMREGRPWTYQTDYAGLAGIIYCMMFGKYIETTLSPKSTASQRWYKVATPFKRYWQTDIWNRLFDLLLNPSSIRPDGSLPLVDELGQLQIEMGDWLAANSEKKGKSLKKMLNLMFQHTAKAKTH